MRRLTVALIGLCIAGCSGPAPKTGAMPGVATGGYDAPKNAEAAAAYMAGFQARYDIPEIDYPKDIKIRIEKARNERFFRDMEVAETRQKLMAKLALTILAQKDPEAKEALEKLKNNPKEKPNTADRSHLMAMMQSGPKRAPLSELARDKIYQRALKDYKINFRRLKIESCRWTEMTRLIGSGHEEMALIHGTHPTHGYKCEVELKTEERKGYPRVRHVKGFWVKMPSEQWAYYGKFPGVGLSPRRQLLDQNLLKDPEGTIMRESTMDAIARSFN